MQNKRILKLTLSAMFIALGWLLPIVTGNIPTIGKMLSPMHIPVMLAGFILGPIYGLIIGFITPITRSLFFGFPVLFPNACAMAFELATYGFMCGLLFRKFYKKDSNNLKSIYLSLIIAMILGRVVYGIVKVLFVLVPGQEMITLEVYFNSILLSSWPGIIVQLILIPVILIALLKNNRTKELIING